MPIFETLVAAEARAKAKSSGFGDGTWLAAHSAMTIGGVPCVRAQRYMGISPPSNVRNGEWVEIIDDSAV